MEESKKPEGAAEEIRKESQPESAAEELRKEPQPEAASPEEPEEEKTDHKSFRNVKKDLKAARKELEETKKSLDETKKSLEDSAARVTDLTDRVQRSMAEFDNFRKRSEKEKSAMFDIGVRAVIEKLLPVVDNFERGLGALSEEQKAEPFAAGMDLVYKQILKLFDELEVRPIEAVGQPFDPDKHNAVMHVEDESVGENTVVQEFQKGYICRGTVVRYSMVKVAN